MASKRDRQHIIIPFAPSVDSYRRPPRKITSKPIPVPSDRTAHGEHLRDAFMTAIDDAREAQERSRIRLAGEPPGLRVQFESFPNVPLKLESLGHASKGIEVLSVLHEETGKRPNQAAIDRIASLRHATLRALSASDCLTVDPGWGVHDHHPEGHGTAMAGLAL